MEHSIYSDYLVIIVLLYLQKTYRFNNLYLNNIFIILSKDSIKILFPLFTVRLGGMLSYAPLDERSIQLLLSHFHDFLQYLQKNNAELFNLQQDYTDPPPDYHRKYG